MNNPKFVHTESYVKIRLHNFAGRPGMFPKMTSILADQNITVLTIQRAAHFKEKVDIAFTNSKEQADEAIQLRFEIAPGDNGFE